MGMKDKDFIEALAGTRSTKGVKMPKAVIKRGYVDYKILTSLEESINIKTVGDVGIQCGEYFHLTSPMIYDDIAACKEDLNDKYIIVYEAKYVLVQPKKEDEELNPYSSVVSVGGELVVDGDGVNRSTPRKKFFIQYSEIPKHHWELVHAGWFKRLAYKLRGRND
jgi:hypothetical protein